MEVVRDADAARSDETGHAFCLGCNSLLPSPDTSRIQCPTCGRVTRWEELASGIFERTTTSASKPEPAWLVRRKQAHIRDAPKDALVDEICPKCANTKAYFYTMQLRSVDEGSTVFYECENAECKHTWRQAN